jgi:hypothetical protein
MEAATMEPPAESTETADAAEAATADLAWKELPDKSDDGETLFIAPNTPGIQTYDETATAAFRVAVAEDGKVRLDMCDDELMPEDFPDELPSVEEAKAWCERRNAELATSDPAIETGSTTTETPKDEQREKTLNEPPVGSREFPVDPARLAKHLKDIEQQNRIVCNARIDYEDAKEEAAALKKAWERESESLSNLISRFNEPLPLFENVAGHIARDQGCSWLFVAGSDAWKDATVGKWKHEADRRGLQVHMARVNERRRLQLARDVGVDSADGTGIWRGDKKQKARVLTELMQDLLFAA